MNILIGSLKVIRNVVIGIVAGFVIGFFAAQFNWWYVADAAITGKSMMDIGLGAGILASMVLSLVVTPAVHYYLGGRH